MRASARGRHVRLRDDLARWRPASQAQRALASDYVNFIDERGPTALTRGGAEHLTASMFVFSADLSQVLLCFHRKAQFWVQVGGHIEEGDIAVADAALREAREETGLTSIHLLRHGPVDVHRHGLAAAFGACRVHRDVGFAAVADPSEPLVVSKESESLGWFSVDALPAPTPGDFTERLSIARGELLRSRPIR